MWTNYLRQHDDPRGKAPQAALSIATDLRFLFAAFFIFFYKNSIAVCFFPALLWIFLRDVITY